MNISIGHVFSSVIMISELLVVVGLIKTLNDRVGSGRITGQNPDSVLHHLARFILYSTVPNLPVPTSKASDFRDLKGLHYNDKFYTYEIYQ